jgi:hypothetical protein
MTFIDSCKRLDGGIDDHLSRYITRTTAIGALSDYTSRAVVAVGLKGVGKSSAFRLLTEFGKHPEEVIVGINPDKFSLHLTNKDLSYTTYRKQFEHDIVIEALRAIVDRKTVLETQFSGISPLITKAQHELTSYGKAVKKFFERDLGISVLGFGLNVGKAQSPVLVGLLPQKEVTSAHNTLADICSSGVKVRIVVDDPEQVFSASRTLDVDLVGGFCLAAIRLSNTIANLKIIALLKPHIYQPVLRSVDDLTRYSDHMTRLIWTADELLSVIQNRLDATGQKWTDVFDGSESAGKKLVKEELHSMTRNGPRDLLRTLDVAFQKSTTGKIGRTSLTAARERAAQDSLDELTSAYNALYVDFGDVVKAVFRSNAEKRFTVAELRDHIQGLMVNDHDMKALSKLKWMQSRSSQTLPELLFEVGTLALEHARKLTLPFEENYTLDGFRRADKICLAPALSGAIPSH